MSGAAEADLVDAAAKKLAAQVIEIYGLDAFLAAEVGLRHAERHGDDQLAGLWRAVETILIWDGRIRAGLPAPHIGRPEERAADVRAKVTLAQS